MTRVFENQVFERFFNDQPGVRFENLVFRNCTFRTCVISLRDQPANRSIVRYVELINCEYEEVAGPSAAIVEDVLVDGLKTQGLLQTWAMVFKHVTLRGRIGRVMITNGLPPFTAPSVFQAFETANAAYYEGVDWALDISQAEFKECDIRGVPARLIRRDPETQAVVTRTRALEGRWRELDLDRTYWTTGIEFLLNREHDQDVVLVAPKRARNFKDLLAGIKLLREAGVAEPD